MAQATRTEESSSAVEVIASAPFCKDDGGCCPYHGPPPTDTHSNALQPIAVVGMAMRLPGDIRTSNDFWGLVMNKKDGHGRVPPSRYEVDSFYHPYREGRIGTKHGYFLAEDPACFDAGFFDLSVDDASHMDPQQRLLLEVVWECLENSGEVDWEGKDIGCYVGVFGEDWLALSHRDPASIDKYHPLSTGDSPFMKRSSTIMTNVSCTIEEPFYTRAGGRDRKQISCEPREHWKLALMFFPIQSR